MRIRLSLASAALVSIASCASPPRTPFPVSPAPEQLAATIDAALAPLAAAGIPRIEVGVLRGGVGYARSIGADDTPASPPEHDLFHAASLTKALTAYRVAQLAADGAIDIDEPAQPPYPYTWRQLVTHTSGLPVVPPGFTDASGYSAARLTEALDALDHPVTPGRFRYSTMGYATLGRALEATDGRPFERQLERDVFGPVGMADAGFRPSPGEMAARGVPGHGIDGAPAPSRERARVFDASGGAYLSVSDALAFLRRFTEPAPDDIAAVELALASYNEIPSFPGSVAGFGWQVLQGAGFRWHAGNGPGHHGFVAFHPDTGVGVVLLTNRAAAPSDPRLAIAAFGLLGRLLAEGGP